MSAVYCILDGSKTESAVLSWHAEYLTLSMVRGTD